MHYYCALPGQPHQQGAQQQPVDAERQQPHAPEQSEEHRDTHPSFRHAHRIHVPITTNPGVRFMINGRPHRFAVGNAYEINNQMNHSVLNAGKEDRIAFIFDYLPPRQ